MNGLTYFCNRVSREYDISYDDLSNAIMHSIASMDGYYTKYKIKITEGTYKGDVSSVFYASQTMDDIKIEGCNIKQIIYGLKYRLYTKENKDNIYVFVVQEGCIGKIMCYIK